jgi:hypothetical protein
MISSLSGTQLDQLSIALRKLGDEKQPLAQPVPQFDDGEMDSVIEEVDSLIDDDNEAEHQRLWGVIEKLQGKIDAIELNREVF